MKRRTIKDVSTDADRARLLRKFYRCPCCGRPITAKERAAMIADPKMARAVIRGAWAKAGALGTTAA